MERYAMFLEWQNQLCQVTMLPKTIYSLNAVLIKWGTVCFIELEEKKILYGATKTLYSQTILIKENKIARIRLPDLRLYYRATVIKTVWYWPQNRITDQWNGTESPEIIPCTCGQLIYDTAGKNIQWRKDSLFSKWCWENLTAASKRTKLDIL